MLQPAISVVLATYNGAAFLEEQLNSILQQELLPFEIIVTDDGSTDGTVALVERMMISSSLIKLLKNDTGKPLHFVGNFCKGMQAATGTFIALSDQDDIWLPAKLQKLYAAMGDAPLVYSDSLLVDENGNSLHKHMSDIRNQLAYHDPLMYAIGAWAPGHTMLFKRSLFVQAMPFPAIVTHDFWIGLVATCYGGISYVNEPLVLYRQHTSNAIGANTHKSGQTRPGKQERIKKARERMWLLYEKCPSTLPQQKAVYHQLAKSYESNTLTARWSRMMIVFRYRGKMLAYKRKSTFMKWLFCIKMFFKIDY